MYSPRPSQAARIPLDCFSVHLGLRPYHDPSTICCHSARPCSCDFCCTLDPSCKEILPRGRIFSIGSDIDTHVSPRLRPGDSATQHKHSTRLAPWRTLATHACDSLCSSYLLQLARRGLCWPDAHCRLSTRTWSNPLLQHARRGLSVARRSLSNLNARVWLVMSYCGFMQVRCARSHASDQTAGQAAENAGSPGNHPAA